MSSLDFPVQRGDDIRITYIASTAPENVRVRFHVLYDDGSEEDLLLLVSTFTANRTAQSSVREAGATAKRTGRIVTGIVGFGGALKRGQFYVTMDLFRGNEAVANLCRDYLYSMHTLPLGQFVDPGPGGGEGHLTWRAVADDIAPADITERLAAANAFRRIYGFVWYYHASGDTASRLMRATMRAPGPSIPTGFSINEDVNNPHSQDITLTANQEGILFAYKSRGGDGFSGRNDNAVLSAESPTSNPVIFPLDITDDDLWEIFFNVTAEEAADRHSIFIHQEEWLLI